MKKQILINHIIQNIGFDDVKITNPFLTESELQPHRNLIKNQTYGKLNYLARHLKFKENPNLLLQDVKSAIVVIKNYKNTQEKHLKGFSKRARYTLGKDYHKVIMPKLQEIADFLQKSDANIKCYISCDSKPVAEKTLALKSGIGYQGKNTLIIHPIYGSYIIIGVVLTTLSIPIDKPSLKSCGTCSLCIQSCPVNALSETGLTITKCLSYQNQYEKDNLSNREWIKGCDICQEVCPHNQNSPLTNWPEFFIKNSN